jgi:hypothetical protein
VLPGTAARTGPVAAAVVPDDAVLTVPGAAVAAVAGSADARARVSVLVTPIEDARKPYRRMPPILDIVVHICP